MLSINELEKKLESDGMIDKNSELWPVFRNYIWQEMTKSPLNTQRVSKASFLTSLFYGARHWFRSYDFIFISLSHSKKKYESGFKNIFTDAIINALAPSTCLTIEVPSPKHYPLKHCENKHVVSYSLLRLFSNLLQVIMMIAMRNYPEKELISSLDAYQQNTSRLQKLIRVYKSQKWIFKLLFKIYRPRLIFLYPSNDLIAAIKAAHELGIKVIEIQHGAITSKHPAYASSFAHRRELLPDSIITQSQESVDVLKTLPNFKTVDTFVLGSYPLFIAHQRRKTRKVHNSRKVLVCFQATVEKPLWELTQVAASKFPQLEFICLFRPVGERDFFIEQENLKNEQKGNFYDLCGEVGLLITIYSSTALEAYALGVPVLLYNYDNFARSFYDDMFLEKSGIFTCDSIDEALSQIKGLERQPIKINPLQVPNYEKLLMNLRAQVLSSSPVKSYA